MIQRTLLVLLSICGILSITSIAKPLSSAEEPILRTAGIDLAHVSDSNANDISDKDLDYRRQYAAQMLSYMNLSVEPCDDFYEFTCGNWKNVVTPRQADLKRNNLLDILYKMGEMADEIMQQPHIDAVAREYTTELDMVKKFYNNCLETELYPMHKSSVYLDVIKDIGGFPAIDPEWNATNFNWLKMSAHMSNYGIASLVKESIIEQYPFAPYFQIPDFGFDIEIHNDTIQNTTSNAFVLNRKRMLDILTLYEVDEKKSEYIVNDIFEFLKATLNVVKEFQEDTQKCSILTMLAHGENIEALEEQWLDYFIIAWRGNGTLFEESFNLCPYLYHKINIISENHKEAIANYLALKFLYHTDAHLKDIKFQKDFCVLSLMREMSFFFDHIYMKVFFNNDIRADVQRMNKEIRQTLHTILQEADWLDETTREAALLKETSMREYIGRFEDPEITRRLLDEMKNLQFVENNYDVNNLNLRKFQQLMARYNGLHFEELRNTTKPLNLLLGMQVNSFYYNVDNAIYIMAGILHPPVFHKAWPSALKYGTLGFLVGHEFTHGFDSVGAEFDQDGNDNYWWSDKSGKVFDERSNCYVDHFQNYTIPEIGRNINGNKTKDENIADAGGLRIALLSYRRYVKEMTKNSDPPSNFYKAEQMPGLDLSPEQLFFVGSAQLWCASYKESHYWEELSDEHTINKYRVLGIASNSEDFAKAFNCPLGSNMNPLPEKCSIW